MNGYRDILDNLTFKSLKNEIRYCLIFTFKGKINK